MFIAVKTETNTIKTFEVGAFVGLHRITHLSMHSQSRNLKEIQHGIFKALTTLERLDIHANISNNLAGTLFREILSLKRIQTENIRLETIPDGLFSGLYTL